MACWGSYSVNAYTPARMPALLQFYHPVTNGINYRSVLIFGFPGFVAAITMNVAMDEIARTVALDKTPEALKSSMTGVGFVVNASGWGMGDENIDVAAFELFIQPQLDPHCAYFSPHLTLGILLGAVIIEHTAFQPANKNALMLDNTHIYIERAARLVDQFSTVRYHRFGMVIPKYVV